MFVFNMLTTINNQNVQKCSLIRRIKLIGRPTFALMPLEAIAPLSEFVSGDAPSERPKVS